MHLLSTSQFSLDQLYLLFETAERARGGRLQETMNNRSMYLEGKTVVTAFYENSTRTRASFEKAAHNLKATVITETCDTSSQATKGESVEDSIRTLSLYGDVVVMRHPDASAVKDAARFSSCPVINAGNGTDEHPTQALLDLYTVFRQRKELDSFNIMFCGDLKRSRPVHSWLNLLNLINGVRVFLAPSEGFDLEHGDKQKVPEAVKVSEKDIPKFLPDIDVLYMTRPQKDRDEVRRYPEPPSTSFVLRPGQLELMRRKNACVLHPLPRNGEISRECDSDVRSLYHTEQIVNGVYLRMALLYHYVGNGAGFLY